MKQFAKLFHVQWERASAVVLVPWLIETDWLRRPSTVHEIKFHNGTSVLAVYSTHNHVYVQRPVVFPMFSNDKSTTMEERRAAVNTIDAMLTSEFWRVSA